MRKRIGKFVNQRIDVEGHGRWLHGVRKWTIFETSVLLPVNSQTAPLPPVAGLFFFPQVENLRNRLPRKAAQLHAISALTSGRRSH